MMMKRIGMLRLMTLGLLFLFQTVQATEKKDTLKVLFIGNSYVYYNNLAHLLTVMSDSMDTKLICTKTTLGGGSLSDHWHGAKGLQTKKLLDQKKYDIVVLQDNSMWPIEHADSVLYYGKLFCDKISKKGSRVFIYNTWSRKKTPETQEQINKTYEKLATDCHATLVPVGDCWARLRQLNSEAELYFTDGSHPSYLGTFLAALCFAKKITGKLPTGYPKVYNYTDKDGEFFRIMQLSDEEIKLCIKTVNEVVGK